MQNFVSAIVALLLFAVAAEGNNRERRQFNFPNLFGSNNNNNNGGLFQSGLRGMGSQCNYDSDCNNLQCYNHVCGNWGQAPYGTSCSINSDCNNGQCYNGICRSWQAANGQVQNGGYCQYNTDCCCGNVCNSNACGSQNILTGLLGDLLGGNSGKRRRR